MIGTGTAGSIVTLYAQTGEGPHVTVPEAINVGEDGRWRYNLANWSGLTQGTAYTLTADAKDGSLQSGTSAELSVTYDTVKPQVAVALEGGDEGKKLNPNERTAKVVFTFDQAVALTADHLKITGDISVSGLESSNNGWTWTAEIEAASVDDLEASVTLKAGVVKDLAGNVNDQPLTLVNFWGDTKAIETPVLALQADTGTGLADGITSDPIVTVTGTPGSTIWLYAQIGDGTPVLLSNDRAVPDSEPWTYNLTSSSHILQGTAYTLTATAKQGEDTSGTSQPLVVTYDATQPVVTVALAGGGTSKALTPDDRTQTIVFTFDQAVTELKVADLEVEGGTVRNFVSSNEGKTWSVEFEAASVDNLNASVTLKAGVVKDLAGNANEKPAGVSFWSNSGPTSVTLLQPTTTLQENASTTTRIKVADIEVADDGSGSNNLDLEGADSSFFERIETELFLRGNVSLNFESKRTYTLTVVATDPTVPGATPAKTSYTLTLTDVNEAPTLAAISNVDHPETLQVGEAIATASASDPDAGGGNNDENTFENLTYSLVSTHDGIFAINGSTGAITLAKPLDYEKASSYELQVKVTDGGNLSDTKTFTVTVANVNEAPTKVTLGGAVTHTPENGDAVKIADIAVADDALGTEALTREGADAASFEIRPGANGPELWFKGNANAESKSTYQVQVKATDEDNPSKGSAVSDLFTLTIDDVNEKPSTIEVTNQAAVDENTLVRTFIADLAVTDPDLTGAFTNNVLSVTNDSRFIVVENKLYLEAGQAVNFEALSGGKISLTLSAADAGNSGLSTTRTVEVAVNDVNEAPDAAGDSKGTDEDTAVTIGVLGNDTDPETDTLSITHVDDKPITAGGSVGVTNGSVKLNADKTLTFTPAANYNGPASYTYTVSDGRGGTDTATVSLTVAARDDAPTALSFASGGSVAENASNGAIVGQIDATDADAGITTYSFVSGQDAGGRFAISNSGQITVADGSLLNFEAKDSHAVQVRATSSNGQIFDQNLTITLQNINEAPTAVTLNNPVSPTPENGPAVKIADIGVTDDALGSNTLSVSDPDHFEIRDGAGGKELWFKGGANHQIINSYAVTVSAQDSTVANSLPVTTDFILGISKANEAPTGVTLSGAVTQTAENGGAVKVANIAVQDDAQGSEVLTLAGADAASFEIRTGAGGPELWFKGGANAEGKASYSVAVTATDQDAPSKGSATSPVLTLTIANVNEAPSLVAAIGDTTLAEDAAWTYAVPATAFADPDLGAALAYTATLAGGAPLPGWLSFDAGTRTFSGTPPLDFNGALDLTVTASDGQYSVSDTFQLTVTPVNDAPVAQDDAATVAEDATVAGGVLGNDGDPDSPALTVASVNGAAVSAAGTVVAGTYGTLTIRADGTYTYSASNANALSLGQSVTETFTYQVSDGGLADTGLLTIAISGQDEVVVGGTSNDVMIGTTGADTLSGGGGKDVLQGGGGNDKLAGGTGSDKLTGGTGPSSQDIFVFDAPLKKNIDTITDFEAAYDQIHLDDAVFKGLGKGTPDGTSLKKGMFVANPDGEATIQGKAQIVYETDTGKLFYDADGAGGQKAVQFAVLSNKPALSISDFEII